MGFREILAETDNPSAPAVVDEAARCASARPWRSSARSGARSSSPWRSGTQMGFAAANPPALRAIFDPAAAAAERGLVPFQSVRAAHGQLKQLGLLTCDVVDPPWSAAAPRSALDRDDRNNKRRASCHSVVFVRVGADFRAAASELARALEADGVAVVDGALGERHATAVGSTLVRSARKTSASSRARWTAPAAPTPARAATSWLGSRGTKAWPFRRHPLRRRSKDGVSRDCPPT